MAPMDGASKERHVVETRSVGKVKKEKLKIPFESSVYSYALVRPRVEPRSLNKLGVEVSSKPVRAPPYAADRDEESTTSPMERIESRMKRNAFSLHMYMDAISYALWPYVLLAMNYVLQMGITYYIGVLAYKEELGYCNDTAFMARFCCVATFMVVIVRDIYSTVNLFTWIWCAPRGKSWEWLGVRKYSDGTEENTGITSWFALLSYVTVIIPKLAIGVCLGIFGGGYLLKSPSLEAVVLHTVTLVFVTNIDELMYDLFASAHDKDVLNEDVRPVFINAPLYASFEYHFGGWLRAAFVAIAGCVVYASFC